MQSELKLWYLYIIQTECGKLYTGTTVDIKRRIQEHKDISLGIGHKGAKFFRGHVPDKLVYSESFTTRSEASKREYKIKNMTKKQKIALFLESENKN